MSYSRGPWTIRENADGSLRIDDRVGTVCYQVVSPSDARLIVAAPDLLEACHKAAATLADIARVQRALQRPLVAAAAEIAERATREVIAKAESPVAKESEAAR